MSNPWAIDITDKNKYNKPVLSVILGVSECTHLFTYNNLILCLHNSNNIQCMYVLRNESTNGPYWDIVVDSYRIPCNSSKYTIPQPIIDTCWTWYEAKFAMPLHDFLYKTLGEFK